MNDEIIQADWPLIAGQVLTAELDQQEMPVALNSPVRIVGRIEGHGIWVIDKPCSLPIHPTGGFNWNSLTGTLTRDLTRRFPAYPFNQIKIVHRIDRLTSGLVLFAETTKAAQLWQEQFKQRQIRKQYFGTRAW
eukprot:GABV01001732.1.p1 GENE.GABV01001732.1~~GABV01001732.1.p1  ORF type:complete len:134 (-),score=38.45 GABV01001732.1:311-712(-)